MPTRARKPPLSRSEQMSRIGSTNTLPELALRRALFARGMRYRVQLRVGRVTPDIAFPRKKLVVFVDGCQWHGCPDHYVRPRTYVEFWNAKLSSNVARDQRQHRALIDSGWSALRFWEHEVLGSPSGVAERILAVLDGADDEARAAWRVEYVEAVDEAGTLELRHEVHLDDPTVMRIKERQRTTKKWTRRSSNA